MEQRRRSITKAIIYRSGSIVLLSTLSYMATRSIEVVTFITVLYQVISVIGYYLYERVWVKIKWGNKCQV